MTQQEEQFESLCRDLGITFKSGTEGGAPRIDYWLPDFGLLVELKTYETERLYSQLQSVSGLPVLVLCGPEAVCKFRDLLISLQGPVGLGEIRYVVTHVQQHGPHTGKRVMLYLRDRQFTFDTAAQAEEYMQALLGRTCPEIVKFRWGNTLAVRPVLCEAGGDPVSRFFND